MVYTIRLLHFITGSPLEPRLEIQHPHHEYSDEHQNRGLYFQPLYFHIEPSELLPLPTEAEGPI